MTTRKLLRVLSFAAALLTIAGTTASLHAQTVTSEPDEPAAVLTIVEGPEPVEVQMTFLELFMVGGWTMYPLAGLSIAGFGLIIYNFLTIRPKAFLTPQATREVEEKLLAGDIAGAREACDDNPSPVTNILAAGLNRIDENNPDPEAMEKAMEEASVEELAGPFIWINYLSIVSTVSPMVGLLGTVSGMIKAFRNIAAHGMGQPQILADNISEALITTATGLIIAIPAMLFYFVFKNKYGKIASTVSRIVGDIQHHFTSSLQQKS